MIKDKIIGYCNSLGLDTLGFIPCRRFEELVEFYKYRKENNLENNNDVLTFLYGYIMHYALDTKVHPYVIHKAGIFNKKKKLF